MHWLAVAAEGVAAVTAGQEHTLLLTTTSTMLSCGSAADGQAEVRSAQWAIPGNKATFFLINFFLKKNHYKIIF